MPKPERETPRWLKALGREPEPNRIEVEGRTFELLQVLKHDFFAYTAVYGGETGKVILKIGRKAPLLFLPMGWIGRIHAAHESAVFRELDDLDVVPAFTGRYQRHGITHEYVEGHELAKGEHVRDDFFVRLRTGLDEIHRRGMAYVDLEKCENVLVADDGRPYLFDFQISWRWPARFGGELWPLRKLRGVLQQADDYHLQKLIRRTRPDLMTADQLAASRRKPYHVRLHRLLTRPFTYLRRQFLKRVDPARKRGERGRVHADDPGSQRQGRQRARAEEPPPRVPS